MNHCTARSFWLRKITIPVGISKSLSLFCALFSVHCSTILQLDTSTRMMLLAAADYRIKLPCSLELLCTRKEIYSHPSNQNAQRTNHTHRWGTRICLMLLKTRVPFALHTGNRPVRCTARPHTIFVRHRFFNSGGDLLVPRPNDRPTDRQRLARLVLLNSRYT